MSFILNKQRLFLDRDESTKLVQVVRKRSEFRMKKYISATDNRAWCLDDEDRRRYFLELIGGSAWDAKLRGSAGRFVPCPVLIDVLVKDKIAEIEELQGQLKEMNDILDQMSQYLTPEQKAELQKMRDNLERRRQAAADARAHNVVAGEEVCVCTDGGAPEEVVAVVDDEQVVVGEKEVPEAVAAVIDELCECNEKEAPKEEKVVAKAEEECVCDEEETPKEVVAKAEEECVCDEEETPREVVAKAEEECVCDEEETPKEVVAKAEEECVCDEEETPKEVVAKTEEECVCDEEETPKEVVAKAEEECVCDEEETPKEVVAKAEEECVCDEEEAPKKIVAKAEEECVCDEEEASKKVVAEVEEECVCKDEDEEVSEEFETAVEEVEPEEEAERRNVLLAAFEELEVVHHIVTGKNKEHITLKTERLRQLLEKYKAMEALIQSLKDAATRDATSNLQEVLETTKKEMQVLSAQSQRAQMENANVVSGLEQELEACKRERDNLQKKLHICDCQKSKMGAGVQGGTVQMQQELENCERERQQLSQKFNSLADEMEELRKERGGIRHDDRQRATSDGESEKRCACMQKVIENLRATIQNLTAERDTLRMRIEDYCGVDSEMERLRYKAQESEVFRIERDRLKVKVEELSGYEKAYRDLLDKTHGKNLEEVEGDDAKLQASTCHSSPLGKEMREMKAQMEKLRSCVEERETLAGRVKELEDTIAEQEEEIKKLVVQIDALSVERETSQAKVMSTLTELHEELEQNSVQLCECAEKLAEIPVLEQKFSGLQRELDESLTSAAVSKEEYEERLRKLLVSDKKLKEELEACHNQLAEKKTEVEELKSEVERLKGIIQQKAEEKLTMDNTIKNLERELETLKQQATGPFRQNDLEEENKKLRSQIDELKGEISTMEQNLCECDEMREFKQQLQNLTKENSQLKKETAELKETITKLEKQQPCGVEASSVKTAPEMQTEYEVLQEDFRSYEQKLAENAAEKEQLQELLLKLKKNIAVLEDELMYERQNSSVTRDMLTKSETEHGIKDEENKKLLEESKNLSEEVQRLKMGCTKCQKCDKIKLKKGEQDVKFEGRIRHDQQGLDLENANQPETFEQLQNENIELRNRLKECEEHIHTRKSRIHGYISQLKDLEVDIKEKADSETTEEMLIAEFEHLKVVYEQLLNENHNLQESKKMCEEELANIEKEKVELEAMLHPKEPKDKTQTSLSKCQLLAKHLKDAEDTVRLQSEEIDKLRQQKEKLEAELRSMESKVETEIDEILRCYECCGLIKPEEGLSKDLASKDAEDKVKFLSEENEKLQEKLKLALQENNKLNDKISKLNQAMCECKASAQKENDKLQDKLKLALEENKKLNDKVSKLIQTQCKCKMSSHSGKADTLNDELNLRASQLDETLNKCVQEKQLLEESLKRLQDELDMLHEHTTEVAALENEKETLSDCMEEKQSLEESSKRLQEEKQSLEEASKRLQEEKQSLEESLKHLQEELEKLKGQATSLEKDKETLNKCMQEKQSLEESMKSLKEELEKLKGHATSLEKDKETLNKCVQEKQSLEESMKSLKEELEKLKGHATSLEKDKESLNKCMQEKQSLEESLESLQKEVEKLKEHATKAANLEKEQAQDKLTIERYAKELETLQKENTGLKNTIEELQKTLLDQKNQLDEKEKSLKMLESNNKAEVEDLKNQLKEMAKKCEEYEKQLKSAKADAEEAEELKSKLKKLEEEVNTLKKKNKDLQGTMEDMEAKHKDEIKGLSEDALAKMKEDFEKQMAAKEKQYQENMKNLKSTYDRDIKNLTKRHEANIQKLQEQHDENLQEVNALHQSELKATQEQSKVQNLSQLSASKTQMHTFGPAPEGAGDTEEPEDTTGFTAILKKLLKDGPNSLTFAELSLVHQEICHLTSELMLEEDPHCPGQQQLSDPERLAQRTTALQLQIKNRQDKAKKKVLDLEMCLHQELKRVRKLRQTLVQAQGCKTDLQRQILEEAKSITNLQTKRVILTKQITSNEERIRRYAALLEQERIKTRVLMDELMKEHRLKKDMEDLLRAEQNCRSRRKCQPALLEKCCDPVREVESLQCPFVGSSRTE